MRVSQQLLNPTPISLVVSEGVRNAQGKFLSDMGLVDAFGHTQLGGVAPTIAQLVKNKLNYKYHWAVADYLQRAADISHRKLMLIKLMQSEKRLLNLP
jgi:hypothetical protein